ncbi:hypothetical protein [Massilia sp. UBA6681]|uniref:hypothetical protein n=1 Tax=Massilia sp. UBA6681 TaxID=1946839 RepID=UPI0025C3BAE7|nr:hypothetical protein [Massilia sp. UBA6681]
MSQHPPCVMCSKFSIVGRSEEAAQGRGYCAGFDKVAAWDDQPCVLFLRARDEAPRRAFAEKHQQKEPA